MQRPTSLNIIQNTLKNRELQTLISIPPGCDKQNNFGLLTLNLDLLYLNNPRETISFRCKMWGLETYIPFRMTSDNNQGILCLNICSNIENLSKYFSDMQVLCVELIVERKREMPQCKTVGYIFINFNRYIVNFTLNEFDELVTIINSKKLKIGEATAKLTIQFYKSQAICSHFTQPLLQQRSIANFPSTKHHINPSQDKPVDLLSRENILLNQLHIKSETVQIANNNNKSGNNFETRSGKVQQKKGRANQFLQEYCKNKPKHTELSFIHQKYGFNHPSIEVMKLKLDEAQLMTLHEPQQDGLKNLKNRQLNILLKCLNTENKTRFDSLIIYCQQASKLKTETKIIINEPANANNQINLSFLYVLPNYCKQDLLRFEIKDAKAEATAEQLRGQTKIQLKAKSGKRMATLQYRLISQELKQSSLHSKQKHLAQNQPLRKVQDFIKQRESAFISVLRWPLDQVILKNSKIGSVRASKIIFQLERPEHESLDVQLQSGDEVYTVKVNIGHTFKQENHIIAGRQIKIVTAKGQISEILDLATKMQAESNAIVSERVVAEQPNEPQLKSVVMIFEALEQCENEECSELMKALSNSQQINGKQIQRLSLIIKVPLLTLKQVVAFIFRNSLSLAQLFHVYHKWNHQYKIAQARIKVVQSSDYQGWLQKALRALKKSGEVMFGLVPSSSFMRELLKREERKTNQIGNEFDLEDIGRVIVLLFERYFTKCIKLTELDNFINKKGQTLNLNSYLLNKVILQIINQPEVYSEYLDSSDRQFIEILKDEADINGEWGLAKVLFLDPEGLGKSSISSDERLTANINSLCYQKTEGPQLKQSEHRQAKLVSQNQPKKYITIILNQLDIPEVERAQKIQIIAEDETITLIDDQMTLPKGISLLEQSTVKIVVTLIESVLEGVFVVTNQPQVVKLYFKEVEAGLLRLFTQDRIDSLREGDETAVRVVYSQKYSQEYFPRHILNEKQQQHLEMRCVIPVAKSPLIKMTIRSIHPTRPNYGIQIKDGSTHQYLDFPNQSSIILKNSDEGWQLGMVGFDFEIVNVTNHLTSNPYCFISRSDKKVNFTAIIQIDQCWDPQPSPAAEQMFHLIIHFDYLLSLDNFQPAEYSLDVKTEEAVFPIYFRSENELSPVLAISQSISIPRAVQNCTISLIRLTDKRLIGQFKFSLKIIQSGICKNERYLISKDTETRLKLTIFQIRHRNIPCKSERILRLFSSEGRRIIESWMKSVSCVCEEELVTWLKSNFQLTLGEIDILMQILAPQQSQAVMKFVEMFRPLPKYEVSKLGDITEEFKVFDYNDKGLVSEDQLKIVKKVFSKSFRELSSLLAEKEALFWLQPQIPLNFIIDLNASIRSEYFDYLSFIDLLEQNMPSRLKDFPQSKPVILSFAKVQIVSFDKLAINKSPCTFLFKIDGKSLAEPIHRCYSHTYKQSNQLILPANPLPSLQIFRQTLNSSGVWEYRLTETVPVRNEVKVLGGSIYFKIQACLANEMIDAGKQNSLQQLQSNEATKPQIKGRSIPSSNHDQDQIKGNEFSKSFWNKSLNETKQKWLRANQTKGHQQNGKWLDLKGQDKGMMMAELE